MTDLIHEAPPPEDKKPVEKPTTERERQKRVYTYIAVLFTAAFILILWSFLSTHRSNQEVIDQLKGSQSLMQSTIEENRALEDEVDALEDAVDALKEERDALKRQVEELADANGKQEAMLTALDRLRGIESAYESYRNETAKELVLELEESGLSQYLPDYPLHTEPDGSDAESPLEAYRRICAKLFPDGIV